MTTNHTHRISHTFRDGSQVTISWLGVDEEGRQRYAYELTNDQGQTLEAGEDLRSGVGAVVDMPEILAAWTGFAGADAETYQSRMDGTAVQEWAYMHDDELSELSCELEGGSERDDDAAGEDDQPGTDADTGSDSMLEDAREAYAQNELDHDRIPTEEGFWASSYAPAGGAEAAVRDTGDDGDGW